MPQEVALGSLVDAELAFARMGVRRGIRDAFLANFADDGIVFEPAPVRLRETWSARPAPADPLALKLDWKPAQAGVARSFDMGYTTGPFTLIERCATGEPGTACSFRCGSAVPASHGRCCSMPGFATPGPVDFAALGAAPRPHFTGRANVAVERRGCSKPSRRRSAMPLRGLRPMRLPSRFSADVRLHRKGGPIASRGDGRADGCATMSRVAWTPIDARCRPLPTWRSRTDDTVRWITDQRVTKAITRIFGCATRRAPGDSHTTSPCPRQHANGIAAALAVVCPP